MSAGEAVLSPGTRAAVGNAAVVVVDVQNDFCHPEGTMGMAGRDLAAVDSAVDNIERLTDAAREAGVPVIYVVTTHGPELDSAEWRSRYADGVAAPLREAPPNCLVGTWGAELYRLKPAAHAPVVVKHRYSAFTSPGFRRTVSRFGVRSLIFTGVTTNVCVETSLRSAVDHDYLATLVTDACAAYDTLEHEAALTVVGRHFGALTTTAELVELWLAKSRR